MRLFKHIYESWGADGRTEENQNSNNYDFEAMIHNVFQSNSLPLGWETVLLYIFNGSPSGLLFESRVSCCVHYLHRLYDFVARQMDPSNDCLKPRRVGAMDTSISEKEISPNLISKWNPLFLKRNVRVI